MRLPSPPRRHSAVVRGIVSLVIVFGSVAAAARRGPRRFRGPRARIVGHPVALSVTPSSIALADERDWAQLVVTGNYADGTVRDLTAFCELACSPPGLVSIDAGCLIPRQRPAAAPCRSGQVARKKPSRLSCARSPPRPVFAGS